MSIQTNCPTIGSTPHLHERLGSKNANAIETKQTEGIPTEKYKPESQASFRPDASAIRIQIAAPQTAAARYNQCSLFIHVPLSLDVRANRRRAGASSGLSVGLDEASFVVIGAKRVYPPKS
jgi:hypothetical protein